MISAFFIVSCILGLIMLVSAFVLPRFDNRISSELRLSIQVLFFTAATTVFANAFAVIVDSHIQSALSFGVYLAMTDWLVVALLTFMQKYTEVFSENKIIKPLVYVLCTIDSAQLIANAFTEHMFTVSRVVRESGEACNTLGDKTVFYYVHLVWVYLLVLLIAMSAVSKIVQTVRLYRKKYEGIAVALALILAANIGYRFIGLPFDISPILYIILAIAIAYLAIFYVPQGIVVRLLSYSVQNVGNGIVCFDKDDKCVFTNDTAKKITGVNRTSIRFNDFAQSVDITDEIDHMKTYSWQLERRLGGDRVFLEYQYCPLLDGKGHYIGCYFVIYDRTKDALDIEKERYRATHDSLTGIYNRRRFFECVEKKLERKPDKNMYIAVLDIKEFKLINEIYGDKYGDDILKFVASTLRDKLGASGSIYGRLTGDRFAACVNGDVVRERDCLDIIDALEKRMESNVYKMHVHVGIYPITDPTMKASVMCDRALMAIQQIKDSYRQTVSYYDEKLNDDLVRQNMMISEFEKAIVDNQFHMFLQPQISSDGLALLGAEALVRWIHPQRGMIPPGVFIEVFEKTGHIYQLDRFIWECACKRLAEWRKIGREDLHISVNISPKDFYYCDIYKTFTELVEQYGINPARLKLEITETAIMTNLRINLPILGRLREYGFQIEIDDFGSGYSSLNTLKDFDVDVLKLDMGFLRETNQNEKSRVIMRSVICMAMELGLTIVAEGVETAEQVRYLTENGCDIFQGYYFSKPISTADFEEKYGIASTAAQ